VARPVVLLYSPPVFVRRCAMCNKTTPDAAAAALTTLMHALIDIECTAELAQGEEQKDRTQFALECIRYIATRSLNDAKNILVADCENGGGYA
ncbi:hypothetical protein ACXA3V_005582, partial [Escherichia coli]